MLISADTGIQIRNIIAAISTPGIIGIIIPGPVISEITGQPIICCIIVIKIIVIKSIVAFIDAVGSVIIFNVIVTSSGICVI